MPNVNANENTIEYDSRGAGDPMLFIMGLGGQLVHWDTDFVDLFVDRGYRAIRFDNRDVGLSTKHDWEPPAQRKAIAAMLTRRPLAGVGYTVADMADDAAGLLDALELPSAHIVGLSMGGMIAQELAIRHPQRVRTLCSIMSNTGDRRNGGIAASLLPHLARQSEPERHEAVNQLVELGRTISGPHFDESEARRHAESAVQRCFDPAGVARQTAAIAGSRDRTELLASVTAPTLVVHGLQDRLVKPSGGIATAKAVPDARMLAFPDMAHDLPRPRWNEIVDAIVRNMNRHAAAPLTAG